MSKLHLKKVIKIAQSHTIDFKLFVQQKPKGHTSKKKSEKYMSRNIGCNILVVE